MTNDADNPTGFGLARWNREATPEEMAEMMAHSASRRAEQASYESTFIGGLDKLGRRLRAAYVAFTANENDGL